VVLDLGHRGEFDLTLIDKLLAITPAERLSRQERW
jgi:hypothetical protein